MIDEEWFRKSSYKILFSLINWCRCKKGKIFCQHGRVSDNDVIVSISGVSKVFCGVFCVQKCNFVQVLKCINKFCCLA